MKGWGQSVRRQDQHQMNSAALLCLHTQGCGNDSCEGVEKWWGPGNCCHWILVFSLSNKKNMQWAIQYNTLNTPSYNTRKVFL